MKARIQQLAAAALVAIGALAAPAHAQEKVKVGFVFFLSGPGAAYGTHARDGAKLVVDMLNAGKVPAPYNKVGFSGIQIEPIYVDEAGGAQKQLAEYRRLVEREKVDMVIGYNSSGDCNAIAPVAEDLKVLTNFFHCGNPQLFEEIVTSPKYSVRTAPHGTMDQVAAARYMIEKIPNLKTIAGINQNYSWGQDAWAEFNAAMAALKPEVKFVGEKFPALGAGEYGAEISSVLSAQPDVVFTSFWGGDANALAIQSQTRGLTSKSRMVMTVGSGTVDDLGEKMPAGTIIGARGPHGFFAKSTPLSTWFDTEYRKMYKRVPSLGSYAAAQAIFGIKAAYEKAAKGAATKQSSEAVVGALRGLQFETANGFPVSMSLANGHQAVQATAYGTYVGWDAAKAGPRIADIKVYPAECVNPPAGVRALDWIKGGFKGAKC